MQGFVWVIYLQSNKNFFYPALLSMDSFSTGWFHFFSFSPGHCSLRLVYVCIYGMYIYMVMLLYCWVLTSAIQAIKRSDEDYMLTNVFVKLNQRKIQVSLERSLYLQSVTSELVSIEAITLPRCARPHFPSPSQCRPRSWTIPPNKPLQNNIGRE